GVRAVPRLRQARPGLNTRPPPPCARGGARPPRARRHAGLLPRPPRRRSAACEFLATPRGAPVGAGGDDVAADVAGASLQGRGGTSVITLTAGTANPRSQRTQGSAALPRSSLSVYVASSTRHAALRR